MVEGPKAGLAALSELEQQGELAHYQPFHAARADLLRRSADLEAAATAYRRALELTHNAAEKRFLERRLQEVLE